MKVTLDLDQRFSSRSYEDAFFYYQKLISRYASLTHSVRQGQELLSARNREVLILCDPGGRSLTTLEWKSWIEKKLNGGFSDFRLALGPPDGFSKQDLQKASLVLSLSAFTFPHELAAVVVTEQIYRILSLMHHHPYAREGKV